MSSRSRRAKPRKPPKRSARAGRWLLLSLAAGLVILLGVSLYVPRGPRFQMPEPGTPQVGITSLPGVAATVTAVRKLPTLSPEQARPYTEISALVRACDEFHPNRRRAILQHMAWLTHPAEVPVELISLYGDQWPGRLVFGAAYLTAVEWKASDQNPESCLFSVGARLNDLLVQMGEKPLSDFQGS